MTSNTTNTLNERFENAIALNAIAESSTNPRRTYNEKNLAELAQNVAEVGVVEPIILRPHPRPKGSFPMYELVAGSRRLRASRLAKLTSIPAMIRDYTDAQVLEIQVIENDQREDVHPLEQADGYRQILAQPGYSKEKLAEKIGHPVEFIEKRLVLCNLVERGRKLFVAEDVGIGHATLLASLPADSQEFAIDNLLYADQNGAGDDEESIWVGRQWIKTPARAVPIKVFEIAIKGQIFRELSKAPWKKDDATLVPAAGACTTCMKRTGANAMLFDDLDSKKDCCLDGKCFAAKSEAVMVQIIAKKTEQGKEVKRISTFYSNLANEDGTLSTREYSEVDKKDKCDSATEGLYVDGPEKGKIVRICMNYKCKTHHAHRASNGGSLDGGSGKKDFWQQKAEKLETNIKTAVRRATVAAIAGALEPGRKSGPKWNIPHEHLQFVALSLLRQSTPSELLEAMVLPMLPDAGSGKSKLTVMQVSDELEKLIKAPKGSPASDYLPTIIAGLALHEYVKEFAPYGQDLLKAGATAFGIDTQKIATEVGTSMRTEFNAKRKKSQERKQSAEDKAVAKAVKATPARAGKTPAAKKAAPRKKAAAPAKKAAPKKKAKK